MVQGAILFPDNFWRRKSTSTNYILLERKFIGESGLFSVLTKCFGFAISWAIFAKLPKIIPFLGVRKNNKSVKHEHVIYHFTARDLEIMNICFAKYSNLANLRRLLWISWNLLLLVFSQFSNISRNKSYNLILQITHFKTIYNMAQIWQFLEDRL